MGLRLGRAMSMGMGRGSMCGAVSAAYLIIGLAQAPATLEEERPLRLKVHHISEAFARRFAAKCGSIICNDLLGVDIATKEGRAQANMQGTFETVCPKAVGLAAELLEEALADTPSPAGNHPKS